VGVIAHSDIISPEMIVFFVGVSVLCCGGLGIWGCVVRQKRKYYKLKEQIQKGRPGSTVILGTREKSRPLTKNLNRDMENLLNNESMLGPVNDYISSDLAGYNQIEEKFRVNFVKDVPEQKQWISDLKALEPYLYKEKLTYIKEGLISGSFGSISLAQGPEESTKLAVKSFTKSWEDMEDNEKQSFVDEIRISVSLTHDNVVRCFGVLFEPKVMVVNEWCKYGSCIDAREKGFTKNLHIEKRLNILITACQGLTYLISKKILHLDIAARNILLDEWLDAKITDFGRSRKMNPDGFYITNESVQPLKWTAPEILLENVCSEKSDVWAFGVAMWEILIEKEPYTGVSPLEACYQVIKENVRLPLSTIKNVKLRQILSSCWESKVTLRPKMKQIGTALEEIKIAVLRESKGAKGSNVPDIQTRQDFIEQLSLNSEDTFLNNPEMDSRSTTPTRNSVYFLVPQSLDKRPSTKSCGRLKDPTDINQDAVDAVQVG